MTNRKIKSNLIQSNLRAREFWDCSERNLCAVWLALLSMGVSKSKINAIDDEFHTVTVPQCRQDAEDGVLETRLNVWLASVGLTAADIDNTAKRFYKRLSAAFVTREAYNIAADVLRTDLTAILYQISTSLGYGQKRIKKILDFIAAYQGDEKAEAAEKLNIHYPDPNELPDVTDLYTRKRKAIKQHDRDNAAAAALILGTAV